MQMAIITDRLKKMTVALVAGTALITAVSASSAAPPPAQEFDAAAVYKAKCAMCHGQRAEKKFDATKSDDVHVNATLKGVDTSTPKMPGYGAKGMTEEQAKALVAYMRSLKQ